MVSDFRPHESYQFFLQEAPELLRELEEGILRLRQDWNVSLVWDLMRVAHSLKGGAACARLTHVQEIAHHLETAFKTIAENEIEITVATEDLLLQAFDCLKFPILEEIQTGQCDPQAVVEKANQVWLRLGEDLNEYAVLKAESSGALHDVTHLLFAEDVAKGLKRLELVLSQNSPAEILDALTIQTQIFRGIGDISELPGFVAIADSILKALHLNPDHALQIGQHALQDFRDAQKAVLKGDRQQGGTPSAILLSLTETPTTDPFPLPTLSQTIHVEARRLEPRQPQPALPPTSKRSSPPLPTTIPLLMSVRQDWDRIDSLNTLVGELISLDNQFLAQNQDHEETLEVSLRSFNRIKQQILNLYRWSSQLSSGKTTPAMPNQPKALAPQHMSFLRNTLEDVIEELTQLNETFKDLSFLGQQYQQILKKKQKTIKTVKTNLLQTQMLPIGELLHQFPRVVRDLSAQEGKPIKLDLQGDNTLIEKAILEKLYDPLVHLVRNAFDHGIEMPPVRQALNKPPEGVIRIKAWHQGHHTYIAVEDDGHGIDWEKIQVKAIAMGLISQESNAFLGEQQLYQYIFEPNFSTANAISQLSGRGMGLYAVQSQVSSLKGTITVQSQLGKGTTFTLRLPLTSTITKLLVFRVGRHLFALPVNTLAAIAIANNVLIQTHQSESFYVWKGQFVPILTLTSITTYHYPLPSLSQEELGQAEIPDLSEDRELNTTKKFPLLLISRGTQIIALKIDEVLFEQDLVIKPFNNLALTPPQNLSGCSILGDGRLVPVLDSLTLVEKWGQNRHTPLNLALGTSLPQEVLIPSRSTILVIDDSLTIRNAVSSILAKAGYRVLQAKDGWEALNLWTQETNISGMICDIEMPRMTGLEFLSRCRQRDKSIPVIMLTYRSGQRYRQLAEQLGASAYLTKPYLDQELLSTLEQCLANGLT